MSEPPAARSRENLIRVLQDSDMADELLAVALRLEGFDGLTDEALLRLARVEMAARAVYPAVR